MIVYTQPYGPPRERPTHLPYLSAPFFLSFFPSLFLFAGASPLPPSLPHIANDEYFLDHPTPETLRALYTHTHIYIYIYIHTYTPYQQNTHINGFFSNQEKAPPGTRESASRARFRGFGNGGGVVELCMDEGMKG